MTMSRKDFEAVAAVVADHIPTLLDPTQATDITVTDMVNDLSDHFATANPNFDRARFLKACGVSG